MFVPRSPRFRLRWLRPTTPPLPAWITDDEWVPPGNRAVYANARTGLSVVLEQLDRDVALLPEFLPTGVVEVFRRTGLDVRFYPVNRDLTLPVSTVCDRLEDVDAAVAVFAHYFGFADPDFGDLAAAAREAGAFVVEDAARGLFARSEDGRLLGATGDVAVFSLHKVLPVPYGGLAVARDLELPTPIEEVDDYRTLAVSAGVIGAQLVDWLPLAFSDGVPRHRPTEAPDDEAEEVPIAAPGRISRLGLAGCDPAAIQRRRLNRYASVYERLVGVDGVDVLTPPPYEGACPYGVAIHVRDGRVACDDAFVALRDRNLPADVFRWAMPFPRKDEGDYPDAATIRAATLVVPTHQQLPLSAVEPIVRTIERHV